MKIVIYLAPNFCDWPMKMIRSMLQTQPDLEVIGLAMNKEIYQRAEKHKDIPFAALYDLDQLEKKWIAQNINEEQFNQLEEKIGADVLAKTVIADKNLAGGWVDGAIIFDTPLAKKAIHQSALKAYIHELYTFLIDLYEEQKPELAYVYTVASGMTYAIAAAARHQNFPFVRFQHSRIQKYFVLDTTLEGLLDPVKDVLGQAEQDTSVLKEFYEPAKKYLHSYRTSSADTSNLLLNKKMYSKAMQWPSILRSCLGILWRSAKKIFIKDGIDLRERPERLNFVFRVSSALTRRYLNPDKYAQSFEGLKDKNYIYFALHVDPEASTLISAPYYANQTAVIEALSKSVPLSSTILVKEHPIMIGKRPRGFYKKLSRMPNVVLINHTESSYQLIQNASLVATITGTVGWEAMVLQKPLLLLGETPYMQINEGYVFCQNYAELHKAIQQGLTIEPASDEALIKYIAAVMKAGLFVPDELLWNQSAEVFKKNESVTESVASYLLSKARS